MVIGVTIAVVAAGFVGYTVGVSTSDDRGVIRAEPTTTTSQPRALTDGWKRDGGLVLLERVGYELSVPGDTPGMATTPFPIRPIEGGISIKAETSIPDERIAAGLACTYAYSAHDPSPYSVQAMFDLRTYEISVTTSNHVGPVGLAIASSPNQLGLTCLRGEGGLIVTVFDNLRVLIDMVLWDAPAGAAFSGQAVLEGPPGVPVQFNAVEVRDPTLRPLDAVERPSFTDGRRLLAGPPGGSGWDRPRSTGSFETHTTSSGLRFDLENGEGSIQAPSPEAHSALVGATFSEASDRSPLAGGVGCSQPTPPGSELKYAFHVTPDGSWNLSRQLRSAQQELLTPVRSGALSHPAGTPSSVALMCITREEGGPPPAPWQVGLVQLVAIIDGEPVCDAVDAAPGPLTQGWLGSVEARQIGNLPGAIEFTDFEFRDLKG